MTFGFFEFFLGMGLAFGISYVLHIYWEFKDNDANLEEEKIN